MSYYSTYRFIGTDDCFGRWNDVTCTCWYGNPDPEARLRWIIGTQSFWITLASTIETVCSVVVLLWLFRFKVCFDNGLIMSRFMTVSTEAIHHDFHGCGEV